MEMHGAIHESFILGLRGVHGAMVHGGQGGVGSRKPTDRSRTHDLDRAVPLGRRSRLFTSNVRADQRERAAAVVSPAVHGPADRAWQRFTRIRAASE